MANRALQMASARVAFTGNSRQILGVRPEHGGRLELTLASASPTHARYAIAIFAPQGDSTSEASIEVANGSLEIAAWQGLEPAAWLEALTRSLLRSLLRSKNSSGEWPRRITRWRPEPQS